MYFCENCGTSFTTSFNMRRHQRESCVRRCHTDGVAHKRPRLDYNHQIPQKETCSVCNVEVSKNHMTAHRRSLQHRNNAFRPLSDGVELVQSAFKCRIMSYRISTNNVHMDYNNFFDEIRSKVINLIHETLRVHGVIKINMELFGLYQLPTTEESSEKSFNTANEIVNMAIDLEDVFQKFMEKMIVQTTEFQEKDSGWALHRIMYLEVNINKYTPMGGSSYIKLPKCIEKKGAVINIENQDDYCFAWAITSALHPVRKMSNQITSYPHFSLVLDVTGMDFPVKLKDIAKFENLNNISVNVYALESKFENNKLIYETVGPLRYAAKKLTKHVNLLLITKECDVGDDKHTCSTHCTKYHYCWIKDLSRLVSNQISNSRHKRYFCDDCLSFFTTQQLLESHQQNDCNHIYSLTPSLDCKVDKFGQYLPQNILKFKNIEKQMRVPFVIYADFESVLKPVLSCEPNPKNSYTTRYMKHEPYSFAYLIKCCFDDSITKFELYRGKDAAKEFVCRIEKDVRELYNTYLREIKPMETVTSEERKKYYAAQICGICEKPFIQDDVKVIDHCHITGKIRYIAAHSKCNLNYKIPHFIPIIFHNLSGFDSHMFIKELCCYGDKIDVIAQSKEKYVSFSKNIYMHDYVDHNNTLKRKYFKLRFIDSFKFLSALLENLGKGLDISNFTETRKHFLDDTKFNLMRQKGVFPYSYVDCLEKLHTATIPTKDQFYDDLNEEPIKVDDYKRACTVWNIFNCKSLGEYSDVYLKSDVLLLCDIFENFRDRCIDTYKLDPCQFFTLPSLSMDCMLRMSKIELELLTDIDMIHFFKKGIRGGISQCTERKHIANNKFLPNYNPSEKSSYIMYLDATNLYGHSMSQPLPYGGFEWLTNTEIMKLNIMSIPDNNPYGYVLEVDIHYPQELHDAHADLPFLVENIIPPDGKCKLPKLIPNLNDKKKYVVHYRTLKQAIEHGLMVMQTHRVLKFKQSTWLKEYIDFNTKLRNKSKTKFEKNLYKLFNNAVFGKTMENVENRRDIKLITHWENHVNKLGAQTLISRLNFKTCSIFTEDLVAIHMGKVKILYDKPIYIGFSILDISKTVLYDFYYNFIKTEFSENASLLYTDTDSLILKVYTDDFYKIISNNSDKFDTSNYKKNNRFNIPVSQSVLGKMKDEFSGDVIKCFYGTGAKAYYVESLSTEMKKAKGVKKSVIAKSLQMCDYKEIVERGGLIFRKMKTFRSELHDVFTLIQNKVALSHNDNKRFLIPSTCKTLPWGHSDIEYYNTDVETNLAIFLSVARNLIKLEDP